MYDRALQCKYSNYVFIYGLRTGPCYQATYQEKVVFPAVPAARAGLLPRCFTALLERDEAADIILFK